MPTCAYCKFDTPPTREHIIPAFIYALGRSGNGFTGWNLSAEKMLKSEQVIKDVCAACNNGPLSDLDAYAKNFLGNAGLLEDNFPDTELVLHYDYQRLLRWLLKVSFNSARAHGSHGPLFDRFCTFIREGEPSPERHQVSLVVQLLGPKLVGAAERAKMDPSIRVEPDGKWNPFSFRNGWAPQLDEAGLYRLRTIIVGPAVFYLVLFSDGVSAREASKALRKLLRLHLPAKELSPRYRAAAIAASKQTWLEFYAPQVLLQHATDG